MNRDNYMNIHEHRQLHKMAHCNLYETSDWCSHNTKGTKILLHSVEHYCMHASTPVLEVKKIKIECPSKLTFRRLI